jgi:hypothetical protein
MCAPWDSCARIMVPSHVIGNYEGKGNKPLFVPNQNDDRSQHLLKDVKGSCLVWECRLMRKC